MKILVTGGAGFIGSHLTDSLIADGHHVTCVDDLSLGTEDNIRHLDGHDRFRFILQDILALEGLDRVFAEGDFDTVFHMAANSDIQDGGRGHSADLNKTFITTFRTLEAMDKHRVKAFVFASSSAIYGELCTKLHEDIGPIFPISFYGAAKYACEVYISAFNENCGIQSWIYRFPNVVGERCTHGAMFDFMNRLHANPKELKILGDGNQIKPYLYVKDLVDGVLCGWKNSSGPVNYFNLGVESRTTVRKIAEIVVEELGLKDVKFKYTGGDRGWVGDVPNFDYDLSKINALGWKAKTSSDDAMRIAVRAEIARRKQEGQI